MNLNLAPKFILAELSAPGRPYQPLRPLVNPDPSLHQGLKTGKEFRQKWNFYVKIDFKIQTCLFI